MAQSDKHTEPTMKVKMVRVGSKAVYVTMSFGGDDENDINLELADGHPLRDEVIESLKDLEGIINGSFEVHANDFSNGEGKHDRSE